MNPETAALPARPACVSAAAGLLLGAALVLALGWMFWPEQVLSNGARVFFVMLWGTFAYAAFRGFGWVRFAIAATFAASLWGAWNSNALGGDLVARTAAQDIACLAMQVAAFLLLCLPAAGRWFAALSASEH